jgi:hypothetical protein
MPISTMHDTTHDAPDSTATSVLGAAVAPAVARGPLG